MRGFANFAKVVDSTPYRKGGFFMQSLHTDPKFQLRYLVMPDYIYQDSKLNAVSIKIYCFINSYKNPFYFTNEQLAEMFNTSVRTIENSIAQLKELEYIAVKHKTKGGGGKTRLIRTTEYGGSEPQNNVVRPENSEPTNHQESGYKDISKENNVKDNFSENNLPLTPSQRKALAKQQKPRGFQQPFNNTPPYKKSLFPEKPVRRGVSAEDIR